MTTDQEVSTGNELLKFLIRHAGRQDLHLRAECFVCGGDCSRVAIIRLAYVFEPCSCGAPEYEHLTERLVHRQCLSRLRSPA